MSEYHTDNNTISLLYHNDSSNTADFFSPGFGSPIIISQQQNSVIFHPENYQDNNSRIETENENISANNRYHNSIPVINNENSRSNIQPQNNPIQINQIQQNRRAYLSSKQTKNARGIFLRELIKTNPELDEKFKALWLEEQQNRRNKRKTKGNTHCSNYAVVDFNQNFFEMILKNEFEHFCNIFYKFSIIINENPVSVLRTLKKEEIKSYFLLHKADILILAAGYLPGIPNLPSNIIEAIWNISLNHDYPIQNFHFFQNELDPKQREILLNLKVKSFWRYLENSFKFIESKMSSPNLDQMKSSISDLVSLVSLVFKQDDFSLDYGKEGEYPGLNSNRLHTEIKEDFNKIKLICNYYVNRDKQIPNGGSNLKMVRYLMNKIFYAVFYRLDATDVNESLYIDLWIQINSPQLTASILQPIFEIISKIKVNLVELAKIDVMTLKKPDEQFVFSGSN